MRPRRSRTRESRRPIRSAGSYRAFGPSGPDLSERTAPAGEPKSATCRRGLDRVVPAAAIRANPDYRIAPRQKSSLAGETRRDAAGDRRDFFARFTGGSPTAARRNAAR